MGVINMKCSSMITKKSTIGIITLTMMLFLPNISNAITSNNYQSCSPVGSYTINILANGVTSYGVMTINQDGTLTSNHSFNLTQAQSAADNGGYGTIQVGSWKMVDGKSFKIVNSCVDLARNAGHLADPAVPVVREKGVATIKFDSNACQSGTFNGNILIYGIPTGADNLTLTGAPISNIPISGKIQRIVGP
jgi:hypothetical protein